jgi:uncharacterized protein YifE (UPF0438 family)
MEPPAIVFTDEERALLKKYGNFYQSLDSGKIKPTTEAQHHFFSVCRWQAAAETEHEKVWTKHKRLESYEQQKRYNKKESESGIPEYEEGTPRPGWFTDEDWEKMRAADYADMKSRSSSS